jgi:transcription elongation factor SPT5
VAARARLFTHPTPLPSSSSYVDGYLVKDVSVKGLAPSDGVPPLDEVQRFAAAGAAGRAAARAAGAGGGGSDDDGGDHHRAASPGGGEGAELAALLAGADAAGAAGAESTFVKGDKVIIAAGDLAGMRGRVVGAGPDGRPLVQPGGEFADVEPQPVDAGDLAKAFDAGDHVKVVGGTHAGATGLVVRVDGPVVAVFADAAREEISVFARDLAESAEVASGVDAFGEYELHDFVALDAGTVGVVIGVDRGAARVLTSAGTADAPDVRSCRLPDIKRKLAPRATVAQDSAGRPVAAGDAVTIDAGRHAGRSAVVKMPFRQALFVHCREVAEYGGFLCVRARQCTLKGSGGGVGAGVAATSGARHLPLQSPAPHRLPSYGPGSVLASPARQAGPGAGPGFAPRSAAAPVSGAGRALAPNAALVGRTVVIGKGHLRGYTGRVLSATETHARLELEAQARTVTVPLTQLRAEDVGGAFAAAPLPGPPGGAGAPHYDAGGRTPHAAGGATPLHAWGGGATPSHAGAAGSATPGGAWGGATPAWGGSAAPGWGGATPLHPGASTPGRDGGGAWGAPALPPPPPPPSDGGAAVAAWLGAVVRVPGGGLGIVTGSAGGAALVADAAPGPDGRLAPARGGASARAIHLDALTPDPPAKGDAVVVLTGPGAGAAGTLIGLHGPDCVVRLDGGSDNIKVVDAGAVAKRGAVV